MKYNSTSKTPGDTPKQEEKLFESIIDNLGKPKVSPKGPIKVIPKVKPRVRVETMSERIERLTYQYDENDKKPVHLDDPLIVSQEDMSSRNLRPKQFDNLDPSSYPSNPKQKKALTTWEIMVDQAKNPKDQYDRESAKQVRQTILDSWKKPSMRKYLGEDELRLINRHPDQQKRYEIPKVETPVYVEPFKTAPITKVQEYVNNKARYQPGISEDLLRLRAEVNKNMKYVMGEDQKVESNESRSEENDDNYKEVEID